MHQAAVARAVRTAIPALWLTTADCRAGQTGGVLVGRRPEAWRTRRKFDSVRVGVDIQQIR